MRTLNRWKRRYRKIKKAASSFKGWFTANPMTVQSKKPSKRGPWDTVSLKQSRRLPEPTWHPTDSGQRIYGPVREGSSGWAYYDEQGKKVYSKQTKARMSTEDAPVVTAGELRAKGSMLGFDISDDVQLRLVPNKNGRGYTPVRVEKKLIKCGKRRADGKKCRFVGDCPHHRNKMR